MWQQWVNAVLGLWVIAVPFLALSAGTLTWTLAITGIIMAILGVWGAIESQSQSSTQFGH